MNAEMLQFAMHLTGDGEEDIEQMYYDWINSPSTPSYAPEQQTVSKTDEEAATNHAVWCRGKESYLIAKEFFLAGCQHVRRQLSQQEPAPFAESWKQHLQQQIDELRKWKAEAMEVMKDIPAIGKALGVPLGQSIHDKILPAIQEMKQREELMEEMALFIEKVQDSKFYCAMTNEGKHLVYDLLTRYNNLSK